MMLTEPALSGAEMEPATGYRVATGPAARRPNTARGVAPRRATGRHRRVW